VKRAVAPLSSRLRFHPADAIQGTILCYHTIGRSAAPEVVASSEFARQMDALARRFEVLRLSDLVSRILGAPDGRSPGRERVAIAFDDGLMGVLEHALPVLVERQLAATAFLLPGLWGRTAPWPSPAPTAARRLWDEADALTWTGAGMDIGSHGMTHSFLPESDEAQLRYEIEGSRNELQKSFGEIDGFSYPWGVATPREQAFVRQAGYRYAVAGGYGRYHRAADRFSLRRLAIDHEDDLRDFEMKLRGGYDWLSILHIGPGKARSWPSR